MPHEKKTARAMLTCAQDQDAFFITRQACYLLINLSKSPIFRWAFDRMPQRLIGQYAIAILPAHLLSFNEPILLQILDDPLNSSLGDADFDGYLTEHKFGVGIQNR